jgi:hypothetical protein
MKKLTAIFLTAMLLISSAICVSAKSYDFKDNEVLILLTESATKKVENGELEINKEYFADSDLGIKKIYKFPYSNDIYKLTLDKHDFENVLSAVKILKKYEDIKIAEPNYRTIIPECYLDKINVVLKAGQTEKVTLHLTEGYSTSTNKWKSSNEKVATVKNGKITALQEGTAKISIKDSRGSKFTCKVKVTSSPKLTQNKKEVTAVEVKKGETVKVKITGKAKKIDNKYTNTKKAKITSKVSAKTITVSGVKKGTSTLKIKVNGVKTLKLKVKVK